MIDTKEIRKALAIHGVDVLNEDEVLDVLGHLEAAEKEIESWKGLARRFGNEADELRTHLSFAKDELNRLRAKIEAMEKQEPVAQVGVHKTGGNAGIAWSARPLNGFDSLPLLREGDELYLSPGAQPAQKAVAYLDLGAGGYTDIGTDLNDEQLALLPKGRHMLGIVGTYGVDGYVSSQLAPSVPEDVMRDARRYLWLRNAALDWYVGPEYATYNDVVCSGECCNYAGGGVALDSAIDALLAAAQEISS